MFKSASFANAATIVTAVFYIICAILSYAVPDLLINIANSWVHSLSLTTLKATQPMALSSLIFGLVTISVVTWVTMYSFVELYNYLARKS